MILGKIRVNPRLIAPTVIRTILIVLALGIGALALYPSIVLLYAAGSTIILLAIVVSLKRPRLSFYFAIFFLLVINDIFRNFAPPLFGYVAKEILLAMAASAWLLYRVTKAKVTKPSLNAFEVILIFFVGFALSQVLRQNLTVGLFGFRSLCLYSFVYFLTKSMLRSRTDVVRLLDLLLVIAVINSIFGLAQFVFEIDLMPALGYSYGDFAWRGTGGYLKAPGTLGSGAIMTAYVGALLLIVLSLVVPSHNLAIRLDMPTSYISLLLRSRFTQYITLSTLLVGVLVSSARSGYLALLAGGCFLFLFSRRFQRGSIRYLLVLGMSLFTMDVVTQGFIRNQVASLLSKGALMKSIESMQARPVVYQRAFDEYFSQAPLLGIGLGTTGAPSARTAALLATGKLTVESFYVKLLVETGLIGFAIFLFLIAVLFHSAFRISKSINDPFLTRVSVGITAALVVLLVAAIPHAILEVPPMNVFFWILTGTLFSLPQVARVECASE